MLSRVTCSPTLVHGLGRHREADGSYRLNNEFHFLIAQA
jgi:hypothetical protein